MLRNSPYLLLMLATCIWGGNFVAGKALVTLMPPLTMAAVRWGIAFLCLLPFFGKMTWAMRSEWLRHWRMLVFLSVTGVVGFNSLTYVAVQYTGSINASLMNAATPIFVLILSSFVLKESIAWSALPGIAVSIAGVAWIIGRGSLDAVLGLTVNRGDLWMLLAVLCWSLYSVGMKKAAGRFPATPLLFAQIAIALLLLLPISAAELLIRTPDIRWSPSLGAGLLYIGLFASIVAFLSWNRAIELIGPQRCSGFLNLIPLFSALFATAFTEETIRWYHLLGAALIVSGVYLANRAIRAVQHKQKA
ncbi:DMT family transporter [Paenibacillus silviterrae]|uniref:DMT family transporter n=1 Tax=Paenibacillus silviterrae TaxID=3242194 RepID=UPI00254367BA|nr:DMT family transporter [Paenibacillus chinjuensis]